MWYLAALAFSSGAGVGGYLGWAIRDKQEARPIVITNLGENTTYQPWRDTHNH